MSGPSEKAIEAAHDALQDQIGWKGHRGEVRERVKGLLGAAHDPALGLDRSVCLRDVVETLRSYHDDDSTYGRMEQDDARRFAADFIEREFGAGS